jgi:hypothetical protein
VVSEVDGFDLGVGHLDAGRIGIFGEFAAHLQASLRRRGGDQLHDDLVADKRLAAPVANDEREQGHCHVWTAPADQGLFFGIARGLGCGHVFGLFARRMESAGPDVVR